MFSAFLPVSGEHGGDQEGPGAEDPPAAALLLRLLLLIFLQ